MLQLALEQEVLLVTETRQVRVQVVVAQGGSQVSKGLHQDRRAAAAFPS